MSIEGEFISHHTVIYIKTTHLKSKSSCESVIIIWSFTTYLFRNVERYSIYILSKESSNSTLDIKYECKENTELKHLFYLTFIMKITSQHAFHGLQDIFIPEASDDRAEGGCEDGVE